MKRKNLLLLNMILCAAVLAGAFYGYTYFTQGSDAQKSPESLGFLSGFDSGAAVSYKISTKDGNALIGDDVVNEHGIFIIPAYEMGAIKNQHALTYDVSVEQTTGPISISLEMNTNTGTAFISGHGLEEFSNIKLENITDKRVTGVLETKADWAGVFSEDAAESLSLSPDKPNRLKLAFYGNFATDGNVDNPLIIEIQAGGACSSCAQSIINNYVGALMLMSESLSASMMYQTSIIGSFFDAEMQLETQREMQRLHATANKDYHPNDQMCRFGTFVRTVAKTEEKARHDKAAMNSVLMAAYTGIHGGYSSEGFSSDINSRIQQFREVYCDPQDNNNGLGYMCSHNQVFPTPANLLGGQDPKRLNKDIDYARTVDSSLTLEIDFTDGILEDDEADVIALAKNIYWPIALAHASDEAFNKQNYIEDADIRYMSARQLFAVQNVAHNSFIDIVSMKSRTLAETDDPNGPSFMKALMQEFGLSDPDIDVLMGEYPSYYAQMEVLTKKIYQSPDFYTNLYTKPANLDRISASMEAIKLMQARDHYEASLRREMLTSLMVEEALQPYHASINPLVSREIGALP